MYRRFGLSVFAPFAILIFVVSASAQLSIPGEVIDVIDGRTVVVALPTGNVKVELQYIDVPGPGQRMHDTVTEHLRNLVKGKLVAYRLRNLFNDRTIGQLTLDNIDVSLQMLRDGAAWHIPSDMSGQEKSEYDAYAATEATAKNEKRGVWSIPNMKPAWEIRAAEKEMAKQEQQTLAAFTPPVDPEVKRKPVILPGQNPALGNVGALLNGYDAATKTGYVAIPLLAVTEINKELAAEYKTAIEVIYFYKEDERKGRSGIFVVNVVSISKKWRFLTQNELTVMGGGKDLTIGKPKRTTATDGDMMRENLAYKVDRSTLDRIVNGNDVVVKVGTYLIQPADGLKFLLYNMLQVCQ